MLQGAQSRAPFWTSQGLSWFTSTVEKVSDPQDPAAALCFPQCDLE